MIFKLILQRNFVIINQRFLKSGAIASLSPDLILVAFGSRQSYASSKNLDPTMPAFYYPDFFLKSSFPWIQFSDWKIIETKYLINFLNPPAILRPEWMIENQFLFQENFYQLKQLFEQKQLEKAVPYIFAHSHTKMTLNQLKTSLKKALEQLSISSVHLYGCWDSEKGILGLTPEILFEWNNQNTHLVKTMALAGTKKLENANPFSLDRKELFEHQVVVEGICESLASLGKVSIGQRQLLQLPILTHLMTPIEMSLYQPTSFEVLVRALHPTPALGAFPRQKGEEWLCHYQNQLDRNSFGAPVGLCFPEKGIKNCYVAIRNVQWNDQGMKIGAGCGVVSESQLDQEWEELCLKLQAVKNGLDL